MDDIQLREEWRRRIASAGADALELTRGLSDAQFNWKPADNVWSVAQCLDHLNRVSRLLLPNIETAIATASAPPSPPRPWKPKLFDRLFLAALKPDARFKADVPAIYLPAARGELAEVVELFERHQAWYAKVIDRSVSLDLNRIVVASPVSRRIRFSLGTWFEATALHEAYHVGQAQAVRRTAGFPE